MHWLLICSSLTILGASSSTSPSDDWNAQVLEIAKNYPSYGRADRQYRWSPTDCDMPRPKPPTLHVSASDDEATHGQKLYTIFAKKVYWDATPPRTAMSRRQTYLPPYLKDQVGKERIASEVGQVVVKEAWEPVKISQEERTKAAGKIDRNDPRIKKIDGGKITDGKIHNDIYDHGDIVLPFAEKNGQHYQAGERHGLFIMFKVDPKTPGTDQGWVYATVAKDLKTVTSVGTIASCMKCHQEAKNDRLFGLK
ncbi:MAG: cytochrome P460 family protein [Gemmatales bacterium]